MKNELNNTDFESCKNMIYKLSLRMYNSKKSKRPDIQFDDVYAEGQLIYVQCLQSYTGNKGCKFTTYLYQNLVGRLAAMYKCTLKPMSHYEDLNFGEASGDDREISFESRLESCNYNIDDNDLLITAKEELSYEGYQVLKFIISRDWEHAHAKAQPSIGQICRKFGYSQNIVESIMGEIKQFWNRTGYAVA